MLKSLIFLSVLINLVYSANKCFQCSTSSDSRCGDPFLIDPSDIKYQCVTQNSNNMQCFKYSFVLGPRTITTRGCRTDRSTCEDISRSLTMERKAVLGCQLCTEDLCNTSAAPPLESYLFQFLIITTFFLIL